MSRETDAIVARHKALRLGGRVTSITSDAPGRKDGTYHQRWATPSVTDKIGKGLAVDFGDDTGDTATTTKLEIFKCFAAANDELIRQGKPGLAELIYSHATFFIDNGKRFSIGQLNAADIKRHKNHIHVASTKGSFVPVPTITVATPPAPIASKEDDDMPKNTDVMACVKNPNGPGYWCVSWDGGVSNKKGAPFYGSYGHIGHEHKTIVRNFPAIVATNDGYEIIATTGEGYGFGPATAEEFGLT